MYRILLFIFFIPLLWAETKDLSIPETADRLLVLPFKNKLLSNIENERVRSLMLRVSAKQQTYHLVFDKINKNDKRKLNALDLQISSQRDLLTIDLRIKSIKNNKTIKRVRKNNFEKKLLFINLEKALFAIYNLDPQNLTLSNTQKKKKNAVSSKAAAKAALNAAADNKNKKQNLRFKERIKNFKKDIKKKFVAKEKERKEKKKKQNSSSAKVVPKKKDNKEEQKLKDAKTPDKAYSTEFSWRTGYSIQNFTSNDLVGSGSEVEIFTDFQYLYMGGDLIFNLLKFNGAQARLKFNYYFPVSSDEKVEPKPYYDFTILGRYPFAKLYSKLSLGLENTTMLFGSLPEFGAGVELFEYNINSLLLEYELEVNEYGLIYRFYNPLSVSSQNEFGNFKDAAFQKSYFGLYSLAFLKGAKLQLSYESSRLETQREFINTVDYSVITMSYISAF
jgi:hypothetical protein